MKTIVKTNTDTKSLALVGEFLIGWFTETRSEEIKAGYGSCYKCNCRAYEGNASTCSNCGHSYENHY